MHAAVDGHAVEHRAHRVLADAEADVAPRKVAGLDVRHALEARVVRGGQVRGAADQGRDARADGVEHLAGCSARGNLVARLPDGQRGLPAIGQLAVEHLRLEGRAQLRIRRLVAGDQRVPGGLLLRAARARLPVARIHLSRHPELLICGEAERLLGQPHFLCAERRAVGFRGVLLVGAAVRDVRLANDEAGPVGDLLRGDRSSRNSRHVVRAHGLHVPAVGLEAQGNVVAV